MGADAFDKRRVQKQFCPAIKKNVHGLAPAAQVTAFDEGRATETRVDFAGGGAQVFDRRQFASGQNFGFVKVWCCQCGQRQQFLLQDSDRRRFQQNSAAGRNHHRINNQRDSRAGRPRSEKLGDDTDVFGREQHSGFYGGGRHFLKYGLDLLPQNPGRTSFDGENAFGILGGQAGNCTRAVNAKRGECF